MSKILFVYSVNMVLPPPFIERQMLSLIKNKMDVDKFEIKGKGVIGYFSNIFKLRKKIKNNNYDIIHAHYSLSALIVILSFTHKPLVTSFMGSDLVGTFNKNGSKKIVGFLNYFISKFVQIFTDKIIVKSKNLAEYIFLKHKMSIIPNGINFDIFKPLSKIKARSKLNLNLNKNYILFVGDKNNFRKNFSLLSKCIRDLEENNIYLIDINYPIHTDEIILFLNATDVLVLTSLFEGSPNIIKEALACNCRVVSVDVGDVKEHINNIEGCFISKYEKSDLCNKIISSMNYDKNFNSRKKINYLDSDKISNEIIKIYKSV